MNLVFSLVTFVSSPNRRLKVCYWRVGDGDNFRVRFEIKQILRLHDLASHPGDLFWRGPAHLQADWLGSYGRYFCVVPVYSKTAIS